MKKICHFTSAHTSLDSRVFYKQCVSLARAGYEVYLVAQGASREEGGVHVVGIGAPPRGRLARMLFFARKAYKAALKLDCDVYELHDPELLPYGKRLARRGKRVIFDSHEFYACQIAQKRYLPAFLRRLAGWLYQKYETGALKRFSAVLTPCTFGGKNMFEGRCRRVEFIENYPILEEFSKEYDKASCPQSDICYTGAISESRGIGLLVSACETAGARLLLAGEFADKELKARVLASPCVTFLGYVDRETVAKITHGTKIGAFVFKNVGQYPKIDTFGVKIYEYLAAGLPVIVNDSPWNRAQVESGGFGVLVDPDSPAEFSDAIKNYLENPDLARAHGEKARAAALSKYNWGVTEKKLVALYDSICEVTR